MNPPQKQFPLNRTVSKRRFSITNLFLAILLTGTAVMNVSAEDFRVPGSQRRAVEGTGGGNQAARDAAGQLGAALGNALGEMLRGDPQQDARAQAQAQAQAQREAAERERKKQESFARLSGTMKIKNFDGDKGGLLLKGVNLKSGNELGLKLGDGDVMPKRKRVPGKSGTAKTPAPNTGPKVVDSRSAKKTLAEPASAPSPDKSQNDAARDAVADTAKGNGASSMSAKELDSLEKDLQWRLAVATDPSGKAALDAQLAWTLHQKGDTEGAIKAIKEASALDPNSSMLKLINTAALADTKVKYADTVMAAQDYLSSHPGNRVAAGILADADAKLRQSTGTVGASADANHVGNPNLPGLALNDGKQGYGIPGLPGIYTGGSGPGSGLTPQNESKLQTRVGDSADANHAGNPNLPGLALNDGKQAYGIQGLPGIYTGGAGSGSGMTPPGESGLKMKTGASAAPAPGPSPVLTPQTAAQPVAALQQQANVSQAAAPAPVLEDASSKARAGFDTPLGPRATQPAIASTSGGTTTPGTGLTQLQQANNAYRQSHSDVPKVEFKPLPGKPDEPQSLVQKAREMAKDAGRDYAYGEAKTFIIDKIPGAAIAKELYDKRKQMASPIQTIAGNAIEGFKNDATEAAAESGSAGTDSGLAEKHWQQFHKMGEDAIETAKKALKEILKSDLKSKFDQDNKQIVSGDDSPNVRPVRAIDIPSPFPLRPQPERKK